MARARETPSNGKGKDPPARGSRAGGTAGRPAAGVPGRAGARPPGASERRGPGPAARVVIPLLLAACTFAVYARTTGHGFIGIDDGAYVYQNPQVSRGLSLQGLAWALRAFHAGNWHPLTWLSHMLDCQLFGLDAGMHHLVAVLLHTANTLLLYFLLRRMTARAWPSALAAALFALHPLRVESVAWIAERKDVLSALFFVSALWCYVRHVEAPSRARYLAVTAVFSAGLAAKPMLVTLPFVLLLVDYWPLGRWRLPSRPSPGRLWSELRPLVREKLPWFALAAASAVVTYLAQLKGEAVTPFARIPLSTRLGNAAVSWVNYVRLTLWPDRLGILYPYPAGGVAWASALSAVLVLFGITVLVLRHARTRGYLFTGWFWFLGMLVPVSGLIQVGSQAMADRYTYLPSIGLFLICAWILGGTAAGRPRLRAPLAAAAVCALLLLGLQAHRQAGFWRDSITLYRHTLEVAPDNPIILLNLGSELAMQGKSDEALDCYREALRLDPGSARVHTALGDALAKKGEHAEAMKHLRQAIDLDPKLAHARNSMGVLLMSQNRWNEAVPYLRDAVAIDPADADAHNTLGAALLFQGRVQEAVEEFRTALRLRPDFAAAQNNLRTALAAQPPPE